MMDLILVRHTRLDILEGMCYGQMDVDIRSSFPEESEKVLWQLGKGAFGKIFSSPLQRCAKLAKKIAGSKDVEYDNRLMELNFGDWEGKLWSELGEEAMTLFENYQIENHCPGGESFKNLIERVESFIEDVKKEEYSSPIVVVTHGGPIRAFLSLIEKISPLKTFERKIDYGEVIRLCI